MLLYPKLPSKLIDRNLILNIFQQRKNNIVDNFWIFSMWSLTSKKKSNLDFWHYTFNIISWGFLCCLYIKVQIHEMFINQIICTTMRTWWLNWHSRIQNKMALSSKNKNKRKIISQKNIFNKVHTWGLIWIFLKS